MKIKWHIAMITNTKGFFKSVGKNKKIKAWTFKDLTRHTGANIFVKPSIG